MKDPIQSMQAGSPAPLGATVTDGGVNFSVFSKHATRVRLLLFEGPEDPQPVHILELDPDRNRTHYYWHTFVPDCRLGQIYAWQVDGPADPAQGHYYDGDKALLDPYGREVTGWNTYDRNSARGPGRNVEKALRSVVIDTSGFDWEGDTPLGQPRGREIIYEMHAAAFTGHPSCGLDESRRGTYAGLISRIDHIAGLGVNTVELMPVYQFDPQDAPDGLTNYWGYSPVSWFAPHAGFSSDRRPGGPTDEFRNLVKAFHKAGLRVVLDVVYNHTAEGGADGPILSWRGFENSAYYMLEGEEFGFADYTGCGNTINSNHSIVRRMILDSLRYWVEEMHVDGFRFDLASVMARDESGRPLERSPILWAIESEPALARTRLIAEAWDAGGLYQVGSFGGDKFAQWNGPYRDDVRRFLRGDTGTIEDLMARIVGSPDLFRGPEDRPSRTINYVACHDGFCLRDLVTYTTKRNTANREDNRDGSDQNHSWNCGVEGETSDPAVKELRQRQVRNFLSILFLSHGSPMILMGDELGHTRLGNNNPWCQDNELNWLNWNLAPEGTDLLEFVTRLIRFTSDLRIFQEDRFWAATSPSHQGDITWHGVEPGAPDWSATSRVLAYTLEHRSGQEKIHVMLNGADQPARFTPPDAGKGNTWELILDTTHPVGRIPADPSAPGDAIPSEIDVASHGVTALICRPVTA